MATAKKTVRKPKVDVAELQAENAAIRAALERIAALEDVEPGAPVYANSDPRAIAKEALGVSEEETDSE